ncbi:MAG: SH3 domain-containing protein [Pseudooceanicola sp.]
MRVTVKEDWTRSYPDPIAIEAGARIALTGREDVWDGHRWLWARDAEGREGWVPDSMIRSDPDGLTEAAQDYSAMELTCHAGEVLEVVEATHGWCLCRDPKGQMGWVPSRNLSDPPEG